MLKSKLKQILINKFSVQELDKWLEPLTIIFIEEKQQIFIIFPHIFFQKFFFKNYKQILEEEIFILLKKKIVINYSCNNIGNNNISNINETQSAFTSKNKNVLAFSDDFSFNNLIVGTRNKFPIDTAKFLCTAFMQEENYNPFIIWGNTACGKTFLLKTMANELSKSGNFSFYFVTPAEFNFNLNKTKKKIDLNLFSSYNALIIDDFDKIIFSESLENDLILLFDFFINNKKQLILSLTENINNPKLFDFLNTGLSSRLKAGLNLTLQEPDLDMRTQYIKRNSLKYNLKFTQSQELTIAQRFLNFAQLKGIINRALAYKNLVGKNINDPEFAQIIKYSASKELHTISPNKLIEVISNYFELSPADILSDNRTADIVRARQIAMYLCKDILNNSFTDIGQLFGGKNHSTVMYATKKIKELQVSNKDIRKMITDLKKKFLTFTD